VESDGLASMYQGITVGAGMSVAGGASLTGDLSVRWCLLAQALVPTSVSLEGYVRVGGGSRHSHSVHMHLLVRGMGAQMTAPVTVTTASTGAGAALSIDVTGAGFTGTALLASSTTSTVSSLLLLQTGASEVFKVRGTCVCSRWVGTLVTPPSLFRRLACACAAG
jgi:hypothetical protein